ncbi:hypothetical protein TrRE_jg12769 [Triparma retinervis]|uniref:Acyltransferase n=1 Tax=Triparma retinervis TaxID=2557542 RepID=A0A9W7F6Q7_9STRA|nr:hypothetical protein TrRE_jg12769 [Triparma retinervis]
MNPLYVVALSPPALAVLYGCWFAYSFKYHSARVHVPWRRFVTRMILMIDCFIWETCCGVERKLHFSPCKKDRTGLTDDEGLAKYKKHKKIMWTACPHHLLIPSFAFAFKAERDNIHARMGVSLDDIFTAAASVLFYIPIIRDIVITLGGRVASPEVLNGMKMFALAPGGIHEMIRQDEKADRIFLRTGFLRFAIKKQLDITPIYLFDENSVYKPLSNLPKSLVTFQRYCHRKFGIGFSMWKGRWDIPFNPIPYKCEYLVGVGVPIPIDTVKGVKDDDEAIEILMDKYVAEVKRLFKEMQEETGRRGDVKLVVERLMRRSERQGKKKDV